MKKTKLTRSLLAAVSIVALTAVMYGCTHSSDDPPATDGMEMEQTPAEQIAALQAQINTLRAQLGLDPIDIDDLTGSVADLQGQVNDLTQQIADRDKDIADADSKAMTAKGKLIFGVLDSFGGTFTPDSTTPTAEIAPVATPPAVVASYGAATAVTPTSLNTFVNGLSAFGADTAYAAAQAVKPATLDANNGFSGTMLTWSNTGKADTMTVYTDIAAPSSSLFSEVHGDVDGDSTLDGGQVLGLGTSAHAGVMGAAFNGRDGGTVTHEPNVSLTPGADPTVVKLPGTYSGAAGSYQCTGADCTSSVNADGTITFAGTNGWTFTANTGAMVSVADPAYMTFGWWMRDDKNTADDLDHVAVFFNAAAAGGTAITSGVNALTGTAKYEGGAAGKYAWRDRVADTAHGGHFTAKAALTANFDSNMMNGSISEFQIGDDGMDPNWTVTLSAAAITDAGAVARVVPSNTVDPNVTWAVGSSEADAAGSWQAQLSNTGAERNDNLPTGVAGAFNAEFGEMGRMLGAFGANITNANPPN